MYDKSEASASTTGVVDADQSAGSNQISEGQTSEGTSRPSDLVKDSLPEVETSGSGAVAPAVPSSIPSVDDITEAMRDVVDPELMVNVVDLGLLYGVQVDEQGNCTLDMTLTSPTCPLTDRIEYDTQMVLEGLVSSVAINWVWLPPWNLDMITEDGREQLRAIGYNV